MKSTFKRVVLYARQHRANPGIKETLKRLKTFLQQKKIDTYIDEETASFFKNTGLAVLERAKMGHPADLIVVVGGDGSLLSAARMAVKVNVPVIGINRGHLGFLTDIAPQNMEAEFEKVLDGEFIEEHRFLLNTRICDEKQIYYQGTALNDVVLMPGDEPHLIQFDLYINKKFVCHHRADGFIVATPTGSTAYSLSAGGPILHPSLNAFVLVPMFAHSLSSRPIVVEATSHIELRINAKNEHSPRVSCDGHERKLIKPMQKILIEKNAQKLRLLHPNSHCYFDTLREKLGWENRSAL